MTKYDMSMVRGDTLVFFFKINELSSNRVDSLTFTCKQNDTDDAEIFQKTIGDGITLVDSEENLWKVRVAPEDTAGITGGKYVYDIQLGIGGIPIEVTLSMLAPTIEIVTPLQSSAAYLEKIDRVDYTLDALGLSVVDGKINVTYEKEDDDE